jgi:hypothetical protein
MVVALLAAFALVGCSQKVATPLAFRQQEQADVVLSFLDWGSLDLTKPKVEGKTSVAKEQLPGILDQAKVGRGLVVVVLDKRAEQVPISELEAFFLQLGFQRVIVQQAVSDFDPKGLPILSDSAQRSR